MGSKEYLNKRARFDYFIEEEIEAGVVLSGLEVKAIRSGKLNMDSTYAKFLGGELYWVGANINAPGADNSNSRKLLVHRAEFVKLNSKVEQKNYALVPLKGYFKRGKFKLLLGLGKGKKKFDKRETIKQREQQREIGRKVRQATR